MEEAGFRPGLLRVSKGGLARRGRAWEIIGDPKGLYAVETR